MNRYYLDLKFQLPLFSDNSVIDQITNPDISVKPLDPSYINRGTIALDRFNPDLVNWLETLGVSPMCSDFFYRIPYNVGPIHTDGKPADKGKLNWIFGQDDQSIMYWYQLKHQRDGQYGVGAFGTGYTLYEEEDLDLVESGVIKGNPTLVNIGVPHRIINGSMKRLCVTMHLRDHKTGKEPTWDRCLEMFGQFIDT
jgi:hypothetical protein